MSDVKIGSLTNVQRFTRVCASVAPYVPEAAAFVCEYFKNLELSLKIKTVFCALGAAALLSTFHSSVLAQQSVVPIDSAVRTSFDAISSDPRVTSALTRIEAREAEMIREQFRLTEIPAPPFKEEVRAAYYLTLMQDRGLEDAYIDSEGNAIGIRRGNGDGPTLLIAAHLDTVFPEGVDTSIELRGGRYYAPGIGDDTRGLAAMLSIIETLNNSGIQTHGDIIFAANVGEEGRGDLRGIKAIFRDHPEIDGFVSIDGVRLRRITTGGTGSRRFEFRFSGPGGHSFGAFGLASAIHAMGRAINKIADLETPSFPKTTFTVGTVAGGTSVNSIAADAVFALDMRSNDREQLALLEERAKAAALEAVNEENARWRNGEISVDFVLIGDRPVGRTATEESLVQAAALAFDKLGIELQQLSISSTDSNVPMSMGIPAITIAGGGNGGGAHSPDEWFVPTNSHEGPQTSFLIILAMVGIQGVDTGLLEQRSR
ncbi:MAG: M20/M25/M40 family metallo-hydrolase [Gammaproteobacteria bacterium]|nr:M20/M25/M40 family metallo-hydrolase [Gammaproteobacteria bacterium]